MRDFMVRLASMKLAEMKFDVRVNKSTRYPKLKNNYSWEEMPLKEIKKLIQDHLPRSGWFSSDPYTFSLKTQPHSPYTPYDDIEIDIFCPEGMGEETFRQIIKSLGIPARR